MKHTYNGILYDRGNIWAVYRLIQTFSIHNQLFHTGSCGVSNKCFPYSQALQHTSYLLSRLPRAARRRAQCTASSVARRLAWPRATSAGTSACSVSICAHSPPDSKSSLPIVILVLEAAILVENSPFLAQHLVPQPSL